MTKTESGHYIARPAQMHRTQSQIHNRTGTKRKPQGLSKKTSCDVHLAVAFCRALIHIDTNWIQQAVAGRQNIQNKEPSWEQ
jgi:hypothetical protein